MFQRVLVANRGEIAVRVIRAVHELGAEAVAVYSTADRDALHVRLADHAVCIGPPSAAESYLRIPNVIAAAETTGCQAVHPGYGFLSENPAFVRACEENDLVFVGPGADVMERMGDKARAKAEMKAADVPLVPGTEGGATLAEVREAAEELGFPVLLKATAGGGGKGMRLVHAPDQLEAAYSTARVEAEAAFSDGSLYLEKALVPARHVEIQVLCDQDGGVLTLGERECSIQRRHQKLIEESPSTALTDKMRRKMGSTVIDAAKAGQYANAGTFEFLMDPGGHFYFMEANTRLQVEHPVTELVTGIDLVQWQLRVAAGEKLPFRQEDITPRGWAIECRITSEDPANGFLPSTGKVSFLHVPTGPGVRWDSGIEVGSEVGLFYDPMLAKLIVWAPTRADAVARMHRALLELTIEGVETSRDFHLRVMEDEEFRAGAIEIQWLERRLPSLVNARPPAELEKTAAVIAALLAERDRSSPKRASGAAAARGRTDDTSAWTRAARLEGLR